jgi:hypothetical protein
MNADSIIQSTGLSSRARTRLDDHQLCQTLRSALGLKFDLRTELFSFAAPGQVGGTEISEAALLVLVSTTLAAQPELFPPSHIRPRRLRKIIGVLRALCADAGDELLHGFQRFVERRLRLQPGSDITSSEVFAAFEADSLHAGEPLMSKHEFHRRLPGLIRNAFGKLKLHEILRANPDGRLTKRNGWRGLKITDGTDRTDGTDTTLNLAPEPTQAS